MEQSCQSAIIGKFLAKRAQWNMAIYQDSKVSTVPGSRKRGQSSSWRSVGGGIATGRKVHGSHHYEY